MPLDPSLTRQARRIIVNRRNPRRSRTRSAAGGDGGFLIYADPETLIALDSADSTNDAAIAAFEARIDAAASSRYTYIPSGGVGQETYVAAKALFDALPAAAKLRPVMFDYEASWWDIKRANPSDGIGAGWAADTSVQTEFARQGVNGGTTTGATFANYKTALVGFEGAIATYCEGQGCPKVAFFNPSLRQAVFVEGVPTDGFRSSSPVNRSYWQVTGSYPQINTRYAADAEANGWHASVVACASATRPFLAARYGYMPSPGGLSSMVALWTDGTAQRLDSSGSSASPPFSSDDYRHHYQQTMRSIVGAWCDTYWKSISSSLIVNGYDSTRTLKYPNRSQWNLAIEAVIQPGPATADVAVSNYLDRNHVCGIWTQTPEARAADYAASVIPPSNLTPIVPTFVPVSAFWLWDSALFYWILAYADADYAAASTAAKKQIAQVRCGLEKMFFGRALVAGDEPIGSTTQSDHDTWFAANNLGDTYWKNFEPTRRWYRMGVGDVTGLSSDWMTNGPLAPYLDATNDIYGDDIKRAIGNWVTEYNVRVLECLRDILTGQGL